MATYTEVSICNLALNEVGVNTVIAALADDTPEARACTRWYAHCRDMLMVLYPWPWALSQLTITTAATEAPIQGWEYAYGGANSTLGAVVHRVIDIYSGARNPLPDNRVPFAVRSEGTTSLIVYTDAYATAADPIYFTCIARLTDWTTYHPPPLWAEALVLLLASKLAMSLSKDRTLREELRQRAHAAIGTAAMVLLPLDTDAEPTNAILASRS